MTITKKVADELIAHLQRPTISIPELQEEMVISYREAHSLIEFAIKRMWLNPQAEGIDYQTVPSAFIPKSLNAEQCKKVYDIPSSVAPDLVKNTTEATGFDITSHDIVFHGICSECKRKDID